MSNKKTNDLTTGPVMKTLTSLALPIMASSFLSTAYNITDMAWIGMLGSKAVAGIGVGGMYVWLSQGLVTLSRMGGQVHAAQYCGQKKYEEARNYSIASLQLTTLFGILFAAICLLFTNSLIHFFQIEDVESIFNAKVYLRITCGFIIFPYLNQTLTGLYTAQGDSHTPFLANLIGLVTNMIFDPLLILGIGFFPRLEVYGAAIATVAAQIVVFLVMLLKILHSSDANNILKNLSLLKPASRKYYASIFKIGVPAALQSSIYCFISMVLTRMVSVFGPGAIATQRVGGQIESISWNTADGFASALNAFTAQNYGAKKADRIRKGYLGSFWTLVLWGGLISFLFICFPGQISNLFFHEKSVLEISISYMTIVGFSQLFMCIELMTIGSLSGLGKTKLCSLISITLTGLRIPLAWFLSLTSLGLDGIWYALTLTSVVKGIVYFVTFQYISKKAL